MSDLPDDLDLTLDEVRMVMEGGEPVEIVAPPSRMRLLCSADYEINGTAPIWVDEVTG